jgi:D-tagatose-1,6-bisphosphate aldolase subunit GatZ/KbaZ
MSDIRNDAFSSAGATAQLLAIVQENHAGAARGIYSICSANRRVLEAGMLQAIGDESLLLIESTSNQVNQFGGYTGQTPADFAAFVGEVSAAMRFPRDRIVLGGDHLGPHVWRRDGVDTAMAKARQLVRSCVLAGYTKIHLDTSMHLAGDPGDRHLPLTDEIVSARAAELCAECENVHKLLPTGSPAPLYVIGTEVPIPGGELLESRLPEVTRAEDVARTMDTARQAFYSRGLSSAWERVIALVVQPGVEFGDVSVFPYDRDKASSLSEFAARRGNRVYEAHSTDYQTRSALREMVSDHFAILKVGPWLTFAFREAVFALAAIEREWLAGKKGIGLSLVRELLEKAMVADPSHWKEYYHGSETDLEFSRMYSYSDRSRYYWPQPAVALALDRLIQNLSAYPAPAVLISQYLPLQYDAVREGRLANRPDSLIRSKILEVINGYALACGTLSS